MASSEHILGIDIGTTSTKAVLFALDGTIVGQHAMGYPLLSPQADVQEQEPQAIYRAAVGSVRTVVERCPQEAKGLIGMAFSAAMHSLIAVDEQGELLTNSITWADRRSAPWVDKIRHQYDAHDLYVRTGTPIHPMSPLVKLMWLRDEKPELFERAAKFISIKEYVIHRWFGQYVVDYSIANATGLFNMKALDWDSEALELTGITTSQLGQLVPTTHILSPMTPAAASSLGIPADTPVVVGASDGVLANLGVGAIAPDTVAVTVGTSGAVRAMLNHPQTDPKE
ncbi:MAG: gluconokinase, partial [Cyanobacteria bacterium J06638_6]